METNAYFAVKLVDVRGSYSPIGYFYHLAVRSVTPSVFELVDVYPKFAETMENLYFQKHITVSDVVVAKCCKTF